MDSSAQLVYWFLFVEYKNNRDLLRSRSMVQLLRFVKISSMNITMNGGPEKSGEEEDKMGRGDIGK